MVYTRTFIEQADCHMGAPHCEKQDDIYHLYGLGVDFQSFMIKDDFFTFFSEKPQLDENDYRIKALIERPAHQ